MIVARSEAGKRTAAKMSAGLPTALVGGDSIDAILDFFVGRQRLDISVSMNPGAMQLNVIRSGPLRTPRLAQPDRPAFAAKVRLSGFAEVRARS